MVGIMNNFVMNGGECNVQEAETEKGCLAGRISKSVNSNK